MIAPSRQPCSPLEMLQQAGRWRGYLALALAVMAIAWLVYGVWWSVVPVGGTLANRIGRWSAGDFVVFYAAGRLALSGDPARAYDVATISEEIARILGGATPSFQWPYPPTFFFAVAPLGWLEPRMAMLAWLTVIALCGALLAAWLIGAWRYAWLGVVFPGVTQSVVAGQSGSIVALLMGLGYAAFERQPVAAGVCFGLLSVKPQFALAPLVLTVALRRWQTLSALLATAATLAAASWLAFGGGPWHAFLGALGDQSIHVAQHRLPVQRMVTAVGTAISLGLPLWAGMTAWAGLALAALAFMVAQWRRDSSPAARALSLAVAAMLGTPYGFDYDLALLLLPFSCLLADWRGGRAPDLARAAAMVILMWLPAAAFVTAARSHIQVGVAGLLALLFLAWRIGAADRRGAPEF